MNSIISIVKSTVSNLENIEAVESKLDSVLFQRTPFFVGVILHCRGGFQNILNPNDCAPRYILLAQNGDLKKRSSLSEIPMSTNFIDICIHISLLI